METELNEEKYQEKGEIKEISHFSNLIWQENIYIYIYIIYLIFLKTNIKILILNILKNL